MRKIKRSISKMSNDMLFLARELQLNLWLIKMLIKMKRYESATSVFEVFRISREIRKVERIIYAMNKELKRRGIFKAF